MRTIEFGPILGLKTEITPRGFAWHAGLAVVAGLLAALLLGGGWGMVVLAGVLSVLVFFVSEWLHQAGHAWAARRVGHPMTGIRFFSVFSASLYPPDEPPLPRRVHVLRSLGGFWINVLIGLVLLPFALRAWPAGGLAAWLLAFGAVVNLFVLGLGALVPMTVPGGAGVTDGAALLRHWRESRAERGG